MVDREDDFALYVMKVYVLDGCSLYSVFLKLCVVAKPVSSTILDVSDIFNHSCRHFCFFISWKELRICLCDL